MSAGSIGSLGSLNLARRPFANARPLRRLGALLWVAGALLLALNAFSIWSYLSGSAEKRAAIARAEERRRRGEPRDRASWRASSASMDLERQNEQAAFLNRRIAERTFAWSRLFDDLAEVLPRDVRVNDLSPLGVEGRAAARGRARRAAARRAPAGRLPAAHRRRGARAARCCSSSWTTCSRTRAFANPDLASEAREGEDLRFELSVTYRPRAAARVVSTGTAGAPSGRATSLPAAARPPPERRRRGHDQRLASVAGALAAVGPGRSPSSSSTSWSSPSTACATPGDVADPGRPAGARRERSSPPWPPSAASWRRRARAPSPPAPRSTSSTATASRPRRSG